MIEKTSIYHADPAADTVDRNFQRLNMGLTPLSYVTPQSETESFGIFFSTFLHPSRDPWGLRGLGPQLALPGADNGVGGLRPTIMPSYQHHVFVLSQSDGTVQSKGRSAQPSF